MDIQSLNSNVNTLSFAQIRHPVAGTVAPTANSEVTSTAVEPSVSNPQQSAENLDTAVKAVNEFVNTVNKDLQFSVDGDTGKTVVKVIDKNTNEVIRQVPSEEMMVIAKALNSIKGLLVQQKA